ncbi:MAG: DUF4262 domain-containing protein [Cyanobacteriota bacterium]
METPNPKKKSDRLFAAIQTQDREQTLHSLAELLSDCGYYGGKAFIKEIQDYPNLQTGYAWLEAEGLFEQACEMLPNPLEQKVFDDIKQYGWHILGVEADETSPGFAYSIGLWHHFQHPEIILFGLPYEVMGRIINIIGDQVKAGTRFEAGKPYYEILENYPCVFETVASAQIGNFLCWARWFYGYQDQFPALQGFWPDKAGKFPWDEGFDSKFLPYQPLLCG